MIVAYTWIPEYWGDDTTDAEDAALCELAEAYLDEHEGPDLSITVRRGLRGEAPGIYRGQQILGYSIPVPDEVMRLTDEAYAHACETWEPAS